MNLPRKKWMPAAPKEWLAHARSDLKFVHLGMSGEVLPEQVCFHAQQAVEKSLKAVLLYAKIDFPFTHDLEELLDTLEHGGIAVPGELKVIGELTPYAVESRYPGYWGEISGADVRAAVDLAEKTVVWADGYLKQLR